MAERATAYVSAEQRFKVSRDVFSRERIKKLHEAYDKVCAALPDIHVGFSLFGSLSKGRKLEKGSLWPPRIGNLHTADVDLIVFYDVGDLARHHTRLLQVNQEYAELFRKVSENEPEVSTAACMALQYLITRVMGQPTGQRGDMTVIFQDTDRHRIVKEVERMIKEYPSITDKALKGEASEYLGLEAQRIARYFHLDVGGGLKIYRQQFMQDLKQRNRGTRETLWNIVNGCARNIERLNVIPGKAEHQYPATYVDVVKYYGLPAPERKSKKRRR